MNKRDLFDIGIIKLVALAVGLPLLAFESGTTHSAFLNQTWITQFSHELSLGNSYPRYLFESNYGMGSPTFYYYPPFAYYVAALVSLVTSTTTAIGLSSLVTLSASGLAMYVWLRYKDAPALLGACLYVAAPYHLAEFYIRGALAEGAAYIWIPLIALGIDAIKTRWGAALLATSYALLIVTHLPTALLTSLFLILPLALMQIGKEPRSFFPLVTAGIIGLGMSSIYLIPALGLQEHMQREALFNPYFDPSNWTPWSSPNREFSVPLTSLAAAGIALAILIYRNDKISAIHLGVTAVLAAGAIPIFWSVVPIVYQVQFPWRLLVIVEFLFVTALVLNKFPVRTLSIPILFVVIGSVALMPEAIRHTLSPSYKGYNEDAPEYIPQGWESRVERGPGQPSVIEQIAALPEIEGGVIKQTYPSIVIEVDEPGTVVLRRFYFPAWEGVGPSGPIMLRNEASLIAFEAEEPGRYELVFLPMKIEAVSAMVSIASIAVGLSLWLLFRWRSSVHRRD